MDFTVATWNVRRKSFAAAWEQLEFNPDVFLLQESSVSMQAIQDRKGVWNRIGERHWGTGIVSRSYELEAVDLIKPSHPGTLAIANVLIPRSPVVQVISLYGQMINDYSITTLHRMLSDLTPLIDNYARKNIILAGDFNASLQWDSKQPNKSHELLFERIKDFGFFDCLARFHLFPVQTWRKYEDVPWQLDHIYASKSLFDNLKSCEVIDTPKVRAFSDHNPIVATFDL